MVKSELIEKLCDAYPNILRRDMEKIISVIINEMIEALRRDQNVQIRGWGCLKVITRKARIGRNPKNSKVIQIPAKKAIKWKMSRILYNRLNNNFDENKIPATN